MNNDQALDAFMSAVAEINARLAEIAEKADDHFDVHPDAVTWGHVGDVRQTLAELTQITDRLFKRGEFA